MTSSGHANSTLNVITWRRVTRERASDVEKRGSMFVVRGVQLGNDFESRHPVEGNFGSEFWAICNHCKVMAGVMTARSCKTWKFVEEFLRFW